MYVCRFSLPENWEPLTIIIILPFFPRFNFRHISTKTTYSLLQIKVSLLLTIRCERTNTLKFNKNLLGKNVKTKETGGRLNYVIAHLASILEEPNIQKQMIKQEQTSYPPLHTERFLITQIPDAMMSRCFVLQRTYLHQKQKSKSGWDSSARAWTHVAPFARFAYR